MAQSVILAKKAEDLSLIPSIHVKSQAWQSVPVTPMLWRQRPEDPWNSRANQPHLIQNSRFSEQFCHKN